MTFTPGDFKLIQTLDFEIEDDEYSHKTRDDVYIQACVYGSYFIPYLWTDKNTVRHGKTYSNFKQAVEALNRMVSA